MICNNFLLDGAAAAVLSLTRRAGRKTYITYPPFQAIDALTTLLLR